MKKLKTWYIILYFSLFPLIPRVYNSFFVTMREETFLFTILSSFIFAAPFLLGFVRSKKYIHITGTLVALLSLFELFYGFVFKGPLTKDMIFVAFNTNLNESKEFLSDYLGVEVVIIFLLYVLLWAFFAFTLKKLDATRFETKPKIIIFLLIAPLISQLFQKKFNMSKVLDTYARANMPIQFLYSIYSYNQDMKLLRDNITSTAPIKGLSRRLHTNEYETHVFVIGEATTSRKMSLYGHYRNTTPHLDSIKNDLYVFNNVQATSPPVTDVNVTRMLTLLEQSSNDRSLLQTSIIKIMKQVGFNTYWISNQGAIGHKMTIISAIGMVANEVNFTSTSTRFNLDERILPVLRKQLSDNSMRKKFIIIHLNGAHNTYSHRYPKEFNKFTTFNDIPRKSFHTNKKLEIINQYDNAILYGDWILTQILKLVQQQKGLKSLVYIPDHGEEVYEVEDRFGHGGSIPTPGNYEIPLIMWLDPTYKSKLDYIIQPNRAYTSDNIIHTLMNLYSIEAPFFDASKSILSKEFKPSNIIKFD